MHRLLEVTVLAFRSAIEARDAAAVQSALSAGVVFRSPIVHEPYRGHDAVGAVIAAALDVFEHFSYRTEMASADGRNHTLTFQARIGGKDVQGCDVLHLDEEGRVDELTVMVRPLSAALALRDSMADRLGVSSGS
jgi:ketosteroid isomerase-like protein